jgi:hypothetical protein
MADLRGGLRDCIFRSQLKWAKTISNPTSVHLAAAIVAESTAKCARPRPLPAEATVLGVVAHENDRLREVRVRKARPGEEEIGRLEGLDHGDNLPQRAAAGPDQTGAPSARGRCRA